VALPPEVVLPPEVALPPEVPPPPSLAATPLPPLPPPQAANSIANAAAMIDTLEFLTIIFDSKTYCRKT
jgi:hypothetical protein